MNHRILGGLTMTLMAAAALQACAPNPADDVPAAVVEEPAPLDAATAVPEATATEEAAASGPVIAAGEYPLAGEIFATASKVSRSHHIGFKTWTGTLTSDGTAAGSNLAFTVETASLVADEDNRDMMTDKFESEMKGSDFFDVATYPQATFTSTSITEGVDPGFTNAGDATHTISGQLIMRGVTKDVSFPATVVINEDGSFTAKAEFAVNRKDFNIVYPGAPDDLIRDEVVITVDLMGGPAAN